MDRLGAGAALAAQDVGRLAGVGAEEDGVDIHREMSRERRLARSCVAEEAEYLRRSSAGLGSKPSAYRP
jgi:hypothetical protein